jgi:HemY protein
MKKIILFFCILTAAVSVGLMIEKDAGYVLITYHHIRVETSVWVALILTIASFVMCYLCLRFLHHIKHLPGKINTWNKQSNAKRLSKNLYLGTIAYLEENWKSAEKYFSGTLQQAPTELIYYLLAAHAANSQQLYSNRDHYIDLAHQQYQCAGFVIQLSKARLCVKAKQREQALAILKQLSSHHFKHPAVTRHLTELYLALEDWSSLYSLFGAVKKYNVFSKEHFLRIEHLLYRHLLQQPHHAVSTLSSLWKCMPQYLKYDPIIVNVYTRSLAHHHNILTGLSVIENSLKHRWDHNLLSLYGEYVYTDINIQLKVTKKWLTRYPNDPVLLFVIGKIYFYHHQWTQAKEYLLKSLSISEQPNAYLLIAQAEEKLGNTDRALMYFDGFASLSNEKVKY